jgi:preprotein translocase subunit SecD
VAWHCCAAKSFGGGEEMRDLYKNYRLWILVLLLAGSLITIHPNINARGVVITSAKNPAPSDIKDYLLTNINGVEINSVQDFARASSLLLPNDTVRMSVLREKGPFMYEEQQVYPFIAEEKDNQTFIGLQVKPLEPTKLSFGIELSGGTKLVLKPAENITALEYENVLDILRRRLDLFGVKGATVTTVTDLAGDKYVQVQLASVTNEEAIDLISKEGKFEAKIGNATVFSGIDIIDVCLSSGAQCAYYIRPLDAGGGRIVWEFVFGISISPDAANSFAEVTLNLEENMTAGECFLNETIDFYIDDELIEDASLGIPCDLKGKVILNPSVTGKRLSQEDAQSEMRYLQSILQSRSLPVRMDILSSESISPVQGKLFIENVFTVFLLSILLVDIIVAVRYRNPKLVFITVFISFSEIFITLGIAAGIGWTLDIASIAGIIASVGTGINDQIVILDEVEGKKETSLIRRIKSAFFIVIAAYFVSVVSMIPLFFAGAGLLRGFAVTTIIGVSVGVIITRPAFAELIKIVKKD